MNDRISSQLPGIKFYPVAEGNYDLSRKPINKIIIHTMDGTLMGTAAWFNNPKSQVSSHYGIGLNGQIIQWVSEKATAYHAGVYAVNQESIGIEHEDNNSPDDGARSDILYAMSARLVRDIADFWGFPVDRSHVIPHREIKATACPGGLDIDRIIREANQKDPMVIENKSVRDMLVTKATSFDTVANYFHFTEDQKKEATAGDQIVSKIKELEVKASGRDQEVPPEALSLLDRLAQLIRRK